MSDFADLVGPTMIAVLCLVALTIVVLTVAFILHEVKWTRRERTIRVGGPAQRSRDDRLAQYQIEPDHPDDHIAIKENP